MKKSIEWPMVAFVLLFVLALPFIFIGFLARFLWFGLVTGWRLFVELLDWALGDDPEIAKLASEALSEIDELEDLLYEANQEAELYADDLAEWMRD